MKFGVVIFPGSNCDEDAINVLQEYSNQPVEKLWHKDIHLKQCDFILLPGGFSYGDYLRSGAIACLSPIMQSVVEFAGKGGYVMGICNGFQILCEAGLLPGALLRNDHTRFLCSNVHLRCENSDLLITRNIDASKALKVPIAHGEGRYYADELTMKKLNENRQVVFRYCDENGKVTPEANPNGSLESIAGVCNEGRNVFGMMPHPERAASDLLYNFDGAALFESIIA